MALVGEMHVEKALELQGPGKQDVDAISTVLLVEMIPDTIPIPRGPWAAGEGSGALCHAFWGYGDVHLGEVLRMTDQKPVPLYLRICTVHPSLMLQH